MDNTSVAGDLQEPEAPEVMFEVFPPVWDMGIGVRGWQCPEVQLKLGRGNVSSWAYWRWGATQHGTYCLLMPPWPTLAPYPAPGAQSPPYTAPLAAALGQAGAGCHGAAAHPG